MRYLVTGGAGLIGSYLCESLIKDGHRVHCVDNMIWGKLSNINKLLANPNFSLSLQLRDLDYDGIFHLASPVTGKLCEENRKYAVQANIEMTKQLLIKATKTNIPILFTSTIKTKENRNHDLYVQLKKEAEDILLCYKKSKIARMGNVYGPRMNRDDPRVIPTFLRNAPKVTIYGDGSQKDSFCWVGDIVEALRKFMDSDYCGILELGSDEPISIIELAKLICGDKMKARFVNGTFSECKIPDISEAKIILNWTPKVKIEDGIKEVKKTWQLVM